MRLPPRRVPGHMSYFSLRAGPVVTALGLLANVGCQDEQLVVDPGGVAGQVCNPITGRPAGGADVSVTFSTEAAGDKTREATADDNGFFDLVGIGVGTQLLEVKTEEFDTDFDVPIESRATFQLIDPACRDLAPPPGLGLIVGQICNRHTGELLKEAQILLTLPDGTVDDTHFTDPATGNFEIETVTGTIVVSVIGVSFRKTYVVEVLEGETVVVEQSADCTGGPLLTTGFITGDICAPDGVGVPGPLVGAAVVASWQDGDTDSIESVETATDVDGHFELLSLDPDDNITVRATKDGFAFSWNVRAGENGGPLRDRTIMPDGINLTTGVGCQPLLPDDGRRYLVVEGIYDRIEDALVRNGIQPEIEPFPTGLGWANDLFANTERLSTYDVIFVNCGAEDSEFATPGGLSAAAKNGLRRYIEQGGSLYVSDWSYELVEQVFPEKIDFFGSDTVFDAAQQAVGGTYDTRVLDADLEDFLELSNFDISFSFQAGSIISQVGPGVTTFLEADMNYSHDGVVDTLENTPVTVSFAVGLGKVIFTSFHQENDPGNEDFVDVLNGPEDDVLQYLIFSL